MCHYCRWKIRQRIQGTGIQCPRYTYSNSPYEMQRRKVFVSVQLKNLNLNRALENIIISHGSPGNSLVFYLFPECRCVHVCMRTMCVQCMRTRGFSAVEHVHLAGIPDPPCPSALPCTPGSLACVGKEGVHACRRAKQPVCVSQCSSLAPLHHGTQEMNKML